MRAVIFSVLLVLISGCAGLSRDECLNADWHIIGFEDGAAGHSASRIGNHRRDCAAYEVTPDKTAYDSGYREGILTYCSFGRGSSAGAAGHARQQVCPVDADYHQGYEQGLQRFCTYDSGYDFGLSGGTYDRVCPPEYEPGFLNGYGFGREIFTLQSELSDLENHLQEVIVEREQIDSDQDALKQKIIREQSLTAEGRTQLLLDIDALHDRDDELEKEKDALELAIADKRAKLVGLGVDF